MSRGREFADSLTTCPVCGHACRVVGSDEGTQHYEPVHLLAGIPSVGPATRYCGCTADTGLASGNTCAACGHRDHGRSGCGALLPTQASDSPEKP